MRWFFKKERISKASRILEMLQRKRSLPVQQLKVNGEIVRRPETYIDSFRKQGWNIDTYKTPSGKGSVYILNEDPAEMLGKGFEILFMAHRGASWNARFSSMAFIQRIFDMRTGDCEVSQ